METTWSTMSDNIGELAAALAKAQGDFNGAAKSSDNPFFKSKYADLHECIEAVKKPLSENGLAVVQTLEPHESGNDIVTTLVHSSGQWIRGRIRMNPKKDDDQGRGSSITYGRRYSFAAIVGLAQKDDDGNDASGRGQKNGTLPGDQYMLNEAEEAIMEWLDKLCLGSLDEFHIAMEKHEKRGLAKLRENAKKEYSRKKKEVEDFLIEKETGGKN